MADEWLTPRELAAELRVPVATVYKWRGDGTGPKGARLGRHVRFRRRDIDTWLAAGGTSPSTSEIVR